MLVITNISDFMVDYKLQVKPKPIDSLIKKKI